MSQEQRVSVTVSARAFTNIRRPCIQDSSKRSAHIFQYTPRTHDEDESVTLPRRYVSVYVDMYGWNTYRVHLYKGIYATSRAMLEYI